jgi:hypothetical protein
MRNSITAIYFTENSMPGWLVASLFFGGMFICFDSQHQKIFYVYDEPTRPDHQIPETAI